MSKENLKRYYGESGDYLSDHDSFLKSANPESDSAFLIKALNLGKDDVILDIACGQGRHAIYLAGKGYKIDGFDFSEYLISRAKEGSRDMKGNAPTFYVSDIEHLDMPTNYNKGFWFFSDLAEIDLEKAIKSLSDKIVLGGKVLFDTDNIFRIVSRLKEKPSDDLYFDAKKLELLDKKDNLRISYPVFPIWEDRLKNFGFVVESCWGDYNFGEYTTISPRLIILAKKIA